MKIVKDNAKLFKMLILILGVITIFSFGSHNASAAGVHSTIYVTNNGNDSWDGQYQVWNGSSGPKETINNAINTVKTGGTVSIANGTYNEENIVINQNMTILGGSMDNCIINGCQSGTIFTIDPSVTVTIEDLNFYNGKSSANGGAIFNEGNLTVINCNFEDNSATSYGGAIYSKQTYSNMNLLVTNSNFIGNIASTGGAIVDANTITNCTFLNNTATLGGAIHNDLSNNLTVTDSLLMGNSADIGGAISNIGNCNANFNSFLNNTAPMGTGDISNGEYMDANDNWWGSNSGPSSNDADGSIDSSWIVLNMTPSLSIIDTGQTTEVTANLLYDNGILNDPTHPELYYHDPSTGHIPDGIIISFISTLGTMINQCSTVNGVVTSSLNAGNLGGIANVTATLNDQTLNSLVKIIDLNPPTAKSSISGGLYNTDKVIILSINEDGTIYYTLNGSIPSVTSTKYTQPITVSSTTTLKYVAVDTSGNKSPVYTQTYTIDKIAPKVSKTTPTNLKTGVSRTASITIKFSENIFKSTNFKKITIKDLNTNKYISVSAIISGDTLTLKTNTKYANYWYEVEIPGIAVRDQAGNPLKTTYIFKFKTI